ncbi:MlaD family protein [Yersinia alsatica]|uniref:MlaD family protein n=1 Tax=Yersinia alsatica TaxID=2890317 RepID=UPI0011A37205|nr:MlaD family protein [Yersinia alsatica]
METRAHHVVIGLFTLIVVSAALLFCLWLTGAGSDRQFKLYDIVFNEPVSGLSQGSTVQYSGIRVGEVTQLRLDRDNPSKVWARIRVSASTPIREDTQARLTVAGITGTSNIQFSSSSQSSPLLESKDGEVPVIIATPSPLSQLLANGENFMTNANEVLVRLNQLLAPDNQQRLITTLDNLALVTQTVADQRQDIRTMLQQLAQASKQANETLAQTNHLLRNANGLMDGQGKQLMSDAAKTMASLQNTSIILNKLVNENKTSLNNGMQGMNELGPAVDELRRTLATLRAAVSRLEENPAALLRGRERTQEFTPR